MYLTFDDGPNPAGTGRVLEALAERNITATFFVLGAAIRAAPGLVEDIQSDGHRVELHGDRHLDHRGLPAMDLEADTDAALRSLADVGVTPTWWRLPWGRPGPATRALANRLGLRIVGWDLDTHDWRGDGWGDQPDGVRAASRRGGVVLMHDGIGPGATRGPVDNTLTLIDGLATVASANELELVALPDPASPAAEPITALPGSVVSRATGAEEGSR